ncbi:MAG TPA: ATP-binding protein [Nitrospiria bacterium]|jgi:signal transduction histidine kinase
MNIPEGIQKEYQSFIRDLSLERLRLGCILSFTLVPLSSVLDYLTNPEFFTKFLYIRIICSFIALLIFLTTFWNTSKKYSTILGIILTSVVGISIALMIRYLGHETPYYAGLNLIILAIGLIFPWGLLETAIACTLIYSYYIVPILLFDVINNFAIFANNNVFILETIVIALASSYFSSTLRLREFKSRFELKMINLRLEETKSNLEQAYSKLKELDEVKSKFFSNVSHELRTPLTLILAPLESILKGELGEINFQQNKQIQIMYNNALRLLKLINNLLDLAKIDAGKMELYYNQGNIVEFIKGIVASVSPMAEKKKIHLTFLEGNSVPAFYFDRDKIEKVILNLLFNALKFTESGGNVTVRCEPNRNNKEEVVIDIQDTGIGIAEEDMHKLFSRFSQIDSSSTRRFEGTGVGLALAKEIVELHQGRIWPTSELGNGTTMTFTLPLKLDLTGEGGVVHEDRRKIQKPVLPENRDQDWTKHIHTAAEYSGAGLLIEENTPDPLSHKKPNSDQLTILLVEDNPDMINFIGFHLHEEFNLLKATNGEEGLSLGFQHVPDLIISDVMMPKKNGYELCKEIKGNIRTKHIPIILLTAKADLSMKIEGLEHGADDYLTKPFNAQELKAKVKSLLNQRRLEKEIQLRSEELEATLHALTETQSQLVHSEKMAALGLLVAGIAHEVNNPVSFAKGSLNNLKRSLDDINEHLNTGKEEPVSEETLGDIKNSMGIIKSGLERTEAIIKDLKNFLQKDQIHFKINDLHAGLDSTLNLLKHELGQGIQVEKQYGDIGMVETIPSQLNQVFMNLLQNAIHAIQKKGEKKGEISIKTEKTDQEILICIRDSGTGMKKEVLSHIFEPFFTTKEVGVGTGLGLSVSHRIILNHNGTLEVQSEEGKGSEFKILLPIKQNVKEDSPSLTSASIQLNPSPGNEIHGRGN